MTEEGSTNFDFVVNTSLNKKICELKNEIEQNKNLNYVFFIQIKNKWEDIDDVGYYCCENDCINNEKPYGNCIEGNGYINLINDENIKYINCEEGKGYIEVFNFIKFRFSGKNQLSIILANNEFKQTLEFCFNYSLFYFEIKSKIEGEDKNENQLDIALANYDDIIQLQINNSFIFYYVNKEPKKFKLTQTFSWNNGDIFGCGIVYPPTNKINELPYVFFTQNGKQIGKAILLKDSFNFYKPCISLKCCSVETNFGNDLINKPFCYGISKHFVLEEFYDDSDIYVSDVEENEIESDFELIKHQKLNSDLLNEELKQTFQKMFVELKNENFKQINDLKEIIEKKDEKIISLENQIKQGSDLSDTKIGELKIKLEKLNNLICKKVNFVQIKNKWKKISDSIYKCCENYCINTDKSIGNCIEGNGYINLIDDENIKYINCVEGKGENKYSIVFPENIFKKPEGYSINYSLYYFEIKCKIEGENKNEWIVIGLKDCNNNCIRFIAKNGTIMNEINEEFKLPKFSWNNGDIFGIGLVYPPTEINELPYIFFTQNGKQIGKGIISKGNCDSYKPYIILKCCSAEETNFGNNLKEKPFCYDISKHFVLKEFN
uniref:B30.2/SPRY domain-containing protein n=1 Tax=Meloidogyne hapla TaxID=6305 RepID=A0A1I8BK53_MELHA